MLKQLITTAAAITCVAASAIARPDLEVGVAAPNLTDVTWLRGDAVKEWKSGEVYVLDFWATWCGPCVASIPHINDLQQGFKDQHVHVIGVAIWPNEKMVPTEKFINTREDMNYTIAADIDGKTANAFMTAAGQNGIPTVMVIGKTGKLEWLGHPMDGLDEVVELIVHDKFDAIAYADKAKAEQEAAMQIYPRLMQAKDAEDWTAMVAAADELLALNPKKFSGINILKYIALVQSDTTAAKTFGHQLVANTFADDAGALNAFAWMIVSPESELPEGSQDAMLAVQAANRANDLTKHKDPSTLDTLARAYYVQGDAQKAYETQKKAVSLAPDGLKQELEEALKTYEEAAESM
ncbi:MAG: redoxin domain-containing protein [Phycisphaerales bacterium]|nr:redoxin domain-containing protein [Phycisphaerales bacterium]